MKQRIRNTIVLTLACIMFFVGAGVTAMQICCSSCFDNLVSIGLCHSDKTTSQDSHSCCADESHTEEVCLQDKHYSGENKDGCCKIERISVDIEHISTKVDLTKTLPVLSALSYCEQPCFACLKNYQSGSIIKPNDPVPLLPRSYLTLISVLII